MTYLKILTLVIAGMCLMELGAKAVSTEAGVDEGLWCLAKTALAVTVAIIVI